VTLDDELSCGRLLEGSSLILQKRVADLTEKSKSENYVIKGKLAEKEIEIETLKQRDSTKEDALATLSDQVMKLMVEVRERQIQALSSDQETRVLNDLD
jgi:hypothetical protein